MKNKHFVFDTNTLISAFLFENSVPTFAYEKAKQLGRFAASDETYREFCEVFLRPKFDKYVERECRLATIEELRNILLFEEVTETITDCRDPKDNKFLELAVAANAACITTGDDDLLILHPFRNIPILNAFNFLHQY